MGLGDAEKFSIILRGCAETGLKTGLKCALPARGNMRSDMPNLQKEKTSDAACPLVSRQTVKSVTNEFVRNISGKVGPFPEKFGSPALLVSEMCQSYKQDLMLVSF